MQAFLCAGMSMLVNNKPQISTNIILILYVVHHLCSIISQICFVLFATSLISRHQYVEPHLALADSDPPYVRRPSLRASRKSKGCSADRHVHWLLIVSNYPLVNVYITMEHHHFIAGKTHYLIFLWQVSIAISKYQKVRFRIFNITMENHHCSMQKSTINSHFP